MRALTIRHPWAAAIFQYPAPKDIENRTWRPTVDGVDFRGRIAVHVGRALDPAGLSMIDRDITPAELSERGHIIGTVEITHAHVANSDGCAECGCYGNPWAFWRVPGDPDSPRQMWHWIVEHPRRFMTPIPATGHLQLWDLGPSLEYLVSIAELA